MLKNDKNRTKTRIAVYLIGVQANTILLGKRKNTQHMDQHWSLPAGHVFEGESCTDAILREAYEECGLRLSKDNIKLVGAMHQFSDPFDYTNYIFLADLQGLQIINQEPDKCESLTFFDQNNLPSPMSEYVKFIIQQSLQTHGQWVAEYGWKKVT